MSCTRFAEDVTCAKIKKGKGRKQDWKVTRQNKQICIGNRTTMIRNSINIPRNHLDRKINGIFKKFEVGKKREFFRMRKLHSWNRNYFHYAPIYCSAFRSFRGWLHWCHQWHLKKCHASHWVKEGSLRVLASWRDIPRNIPSNDPVEMMLAGLKEGYPWNSQVYPSLKLKF